MTQIKELSQNHCFLMEKISLNYIIPSGNMMVYCLLLLGILSIIPHKSFNALSLIRYALKPWNDTGYGFEDKMSSRIHLSMTNRTANKFRHL